MESKLNNSILKSTYNVVNEAEMIFIQKWREMFFFKTINTYQVKLRNTRSILEETKDVLEYIKKDIISPSNIHELIAECRKHLEKDICLRKHHPDLLNSLLRGLKGIKKNDTEKSDTLRLEYRLKYSLNIISSSYLDLIINELENSIITNDLTNIEYLTDILGTELINNGWSSRSLHRLVKVFFLNKNNQQPFNNKWVNFKGVIKSRRGVFHCHYKLDQNQRIEPLMHAGLSVIKGSEILSSFNNVDPNHFDINAYYIQNIAEAYIEDIHSAVYMSTNNLSEKISLLSYYEIPITYFTHCVVIMPDEERVTSYELKSKELIYDSIDSESIETTKEVLIGTSIDTETKNRINNFFRQYNLSVESLSVETTYSNLWTSIESLLVTGHYETNIEHIKKIVPSILCSRYIQRILKNFLHDCKRAGVIISFKGTIINIHSPSQDDLEKLFTLLTDPVESSSLISGISDYTLLSQRCQEIINALGNSKTLLEFISNHYKTTSWHIQRIYRIRNNLVHAAFVERDINLIIDHLNFYIRSTISVLVDRLNSFQFNNLGEIFMAIEDNYFSLIAVLEENIKNSPRGDILFYDKDLVFKGPLFI